MRPSTTEFNTLNIKTLKAKAQIRSEARDLKAKAHDLSGLKPRAPELKPGSVLVNLSSSWAPRGASRGPLGGLLGPPEAARGGSLEGVRGGSWGPPGGFENKVTESRYLETTWGRLCGCLGVVVGSLDPAWLP